MSPRGGTRIHATKKPVVVIAGEDGNDRRCLRILLERFCPQMHGRLVEINGAVRLRDARDGTLNERVATLAGKVRARAVREDADVACVFVHEDLDRPDGAAYDEARNRVHKALNSVFPSAHYILAVWEVEAWLLLFPGALTRMVAAWRVPRKYLNKNTGTLNDPKSILMREVSGSGRRYRMTDAPDVLQSAVASGDIDHPLGTNRSWDDLRSSADRCCRHHLRET